MLTTKIIYQNYVEIRPMYIDKQQSLKTKLHFKIKTFFVNILLILIRFIDGFENTIQTTLYL